MKFFNDCRHAEHLTTDGQNVWLRRDPVARWSRSIDVVTGENQELEVECATARLVGEWGSHNAKIWNRKMNARGS
jgi:hypothetical protein